MSITVIRKNKTYQRRLLKIYNDKQLVQIVMPWMGWYSWERSFKDDLTRMICRRKVLENLYWLLGQDCDKETWMQRIDKWNNGRGISGVPADCKSLFFNDDEYLTAIESFNNI